MRNPVPTRRLAGGMPCMLLAALMLVARLIAPSMAMPGPASTADAIAETALRTICHAGAPDDGTAGHDHVPAPSHDDCQLCPSCHLSGPFALTARDGGLVPAPALSPIGLAAPLPPATGPPGRPRLAAQPTGPPALSA